MYRVLFSLKLAFSSHTCTRVGGKFFYPSSILDSSLPLNLSLIKRENSERERGGFSEKQTVLKYPLQKVSLNPKTVTRRRPDRPLLSQKRCSRSREHSLQTTNASRVPFVPQRFPFHLLFPSLLAGGDLISSRRKKEGKKKEEKPPPIV